MKRETNITVVKDEYMTWLRASWWDGKDAYAVQFPIHDGIRPDDLPDFFRDVSDYIAVKLKEQKA